MVEPGGGAVEVLFVLGGVGAVVGLVGLVLRLFPGADDGRTVGGPDHESPELDDLGGGFGGGGFGGGFGGGAGGGPGCGGGGSC